MQWPVEIGIFNDTCRARNFKKKSSRVAASLLFLPFLDFVFFYTTNFVCGDVELNPGPKNRNSCYNFSVCHWNLNSITVHNFGKVNLLQAYNAIYDFDMICLSEPYLDSSVSSDNDNLYIRDYKLVRADHPGNIKRRGACVYFKESLPVRCLPKPYLKEYLIFEISIDNKRDYVVSIYRSLSQTFDDFNSFTTNLEKLVINISSTNPHFI